MNTILLSVLVLGLMGAVLGALLAVASKVFHVEVDPKQAAVRQCLAGANCGGCGYPGCDGYAAAVAAGKAPTNKCVAGGAETAAKVAEIMGVSAGAGERKIAFVSCSGCEGHAEKRFNYTGPQDCRATRPALLPASASATARRPASSMRSISSRVSPGSTAPSASAAAPAPRPAPRALSSFCPPLSALRPAVRARTRAAAS